jgi:hypothetical protein
LQRQRIHHGAEHSNVVALGGVHALHCARPATPEVATSDHDCDIYTEILAKINDFSRCRIERWPIKTASRWTR